MRTSLFLFLSVSILMSPPVLSRDIHHQKEHGGMIFQRVLVEGGSGIDDTGRGLLEGSVDGWIGTDENKFWFKAKAEHSGSTTEQLEFTALYSRNIATFWDTQIGLRQDIRPSSLTYLVAGINGLAPYFFETEVHAYISDRGDVSARLHQENDLLITQRLILQPYLEAELFLQNVPKRDIGRGLSHAGLGLQLRYEFSRRLAPYINVNYKRKFGRTAAIAKSNGEDRDEMTATIGLRLLF